LHTVAGLTAADTYHVDTTLWVTVVLRMVEKLKGIGHWPRVLLCVCTRLFGHEGRVHSSRLLSVFLRFSPNIIENAGSSAKLRSQPSTLCRAFTGTARKFPSSELHSLCNSLDFSLGYLSTCARGHTHNFFFSPLHAREYLRLAPCAHLFGRYAVYRSLLRVLWAWFGAQHASSTFCSFSRL